MDLVLMLCLQVITDYVTLGIFPGSLVAPSS